MARRILDFMTEKTVTHRSDTHLLGLFSRCDRRRLPGALLGVMGEEGVKGTPASELVALGVIGESTLKRPASELVASGRRGGITLGGAG